MKKIIATIGLAVLLSFSASAQIAADINKGVTWDTVAGAVSYNVTLTTNQTLIPEGYNPTSSETLSTLTVTTTAPIAFTNLWPKVSWTNGTYSVFVKPKDAFGMTWNNSTNLLIRMTIPLTPPRNLRVVQP